jgi:hypothetical protein
LPHKRKSRDGQKELLNNNSNNTKKGKMKKNSLKHNIWMLMTSVLTAVMVVMVTTSCKDDDEDSTTIVGKWKGTSYQIAGATTSTVNVVCEFTSDGSLTWTTDGSRTENGKYTVDLTKSDVDKTMNGKLNVTWNTGTTQTMSVMGMTSRTMTIMRSSTMFMLVRDSGNDNSSSVSTDGVKALVGKWDGDHSESYWRDWTFKANGTGELYVREGDMGSTYSFKFTVSNYNASKRSGHIDITMTSGSMSGNTYSWNFSISESGRGLSMGEGYYTK